MQTVQPCKGNLFVVWDGDKSSEVLNGLDSALMWIHGHANEISDVAYVEWGTKDDKGNFQPFCGCFVDDFLEEVYRA